MRTSLLVFLMVLPANAKGLIKDVWTSGGFLVVVTLKDSDPPWIKVIVAHIGTWAVELPASLFDDTTDPHFGPQFNNTIFVVEAKKVV